MLTWPPMVAAWPMTVLSPMDVVVRDVDLRHRKVVVTDERDHSAAFGAAVDGDEPRGSGCDCRWQVSLRSPAYLRSWGATPMVEYGREDIVGADGHRAFKIDAGFEDGALADVLTSGPMTTRGPMSADSAIRALQGQRWRKGGSAWTSTFS